MFNKTRFKRTCDVTRILDRNANTCIQAALLRLQYAEPIRFVYSWIPQSARTYSFYLCGQSQYENCDCVVFGFIYMHNVKVYVLSIGKMFSPSFRIREQLIFFFLCSAGWRHFRVLCGAQNEFICFFFLVWLCHKLVIDITVRDSF